MIMIAKKKGQPITQWAREFIAFRWNGSAHRLWNWPWGYKARSKTRAASIHFHP